jgi:hypothetical protein
MHASVNAAGALLCCVLACIAAGPEAALYLLVRDAAGYHVEPLLRIRNGRLLEPPVLETETGCHGFPVRSGLRSCSILYGGERVGNADIRDRAEVRVTFRRPIDLNKGGEDSVGDMALVSDAPQLGRTQGARRRPTPRERAEAASLARDAFRKHAVGAALLARMKLFQLASTDLNRDGRRDLIAVARIDGPNLTDPVRTVLIVAEGEVRGYRVSLERYHAGNGETYGFEIFVDHLDLDGDGEDEILTRDYGWEWYTNSAYRRRGAVWVRYYNGHGCEGI